MKGLDADSYGSLSMNYEDNLSYTSAQLTKQCHFTIEIHACDVTRSRSFRRESLQVGSD